ncbi:hypothetical protein ACFU8W_52190 [Streptomyces sp. NPDC057565]
MPQLSCSLSPCSTVVCVVAICRAHRADVVAVLRALPGLVTALLRRKL